MLAGCFRVTPHDHATAGANRTASHQVFFKRSQTRHKGARDRTDLALAPTYLPVCLPVCGAAC